MEQRSRLQCAAHHGEPRTHHTDGVAGFEGRRRQPDVPVRWKVLGEARHALIRGQHYAPAAGDQRLSKRLGGK